MSSTTCLPAVGDVVEHELLGKGKLIKPERELDSKVLFEFSRYEKESRSGSGRRKLMWVKYNRWVELASLTKVSAVAVDADEDSNDEDVDSPSPDARRTSPRLNKRARTVEDVEPCDVNAVEEIEVTLGPRAALSAHERDRKVPKKPEAKWEAQDPFFKNLACCTMQGIEHTGGSELHRLHGEDQVRCVCRSET